MSHAEPTLSCYREYAVDCLLSASSITSLLLVRLLVQERIVLTTLFRWIQSHNSSGQTPTVQSVVTAASGCCQL